MAHLQKHRGQLQKAVFNRGGMGLILRGMAEGDVCSCGV